MIMANQIKYIRLTMNRDDNSEMLIGIGICYPLVRLSEMASILVNANRMVNYRAFINFQNIAFIC